MSNLKMTETGDNYAPKLDAVLSKAVSEYWNNLSKEEILTYLLHQPTVTADSLRKMLSNEQAVINIGVSFNLCESKAVTDFHTDVV